MEFHQGLSQRSNVAGNQINNVITYITIIPGPSSKFIYYSTFLPSQSVLSSRKGHTIADTFGIYYSIKLCQPHRIRTRVNWQSPACTGSSTFDQAKLERHNAFRGTRQVKDSSHRAVRLSRKCFLKLSLPCRTNGSNRITLYDVQANEDNDLNLVEGERIEQIDKLGQDSEWWVGLGSGGQCGFFPGTFSFIRRRSNNQVVGLCLFNATVPCSQPCQDNQGSR